MITVEGLRQTITRAEALAYATELLQALGFDTDSWQEGDIERTFLTLQATMLADFSDVKRLHAGWSFNATADGEALKLFSASRYDQTKSPAVNTVGPCTLTNSGTQTYTLDPGALVARSTNGVEFTLNEAVTLAAGGSATPDFRANIAGSSGNVPTNSITSLVTPLAGVTITNPGTPWYTTTGRDEESDANLRARNRGRWATQTVELIRASYEAIARDAGATKVYVDDSNPRGPGTVDVLCASDTALLSTPEMTAIQEAFALRAFHTDSTWPASADSSTAVIHPSTLALDVTATAYHDPTVTSPVMQDRLRASLLEFLRVTPVGGWRYLPDNDHVILVDDVARYLRTTPGVRTLIMTTPSSTISVGALQLVVEGTWTLNAVAQQ